MTRHASPLLVVLALALVPLGLSAQDPPDQGYVTAVLHEWIGRDRPELPELERLTPVWVDLAVMPRRGAIPVRLDTTGIRLPEGFSFTPWPCPRLATREECGIGATATLAWFTGPWRQGDGWELYFRFLHQLDPERPTWIGGGTYQVRLMREEGEWRVTDMDFVGVF